MFEIVELRLKTPSQEAMIDITALVQQAINNAGMQAGICHLFVPHTTCGLTVNENADPDVTSDVLRALNDIAKITKDYRHGEGNSPAHVKTTLSGVSHTVFVSEGSLRLGKWQGIIVCEFDGPRERTVLLNLDPACKC